MRSLGLVVLFVAASASAKPSNPAFLGIGMHDIRGVAPGKVGAQGPCTVDMVTRGSGAQQAGLQPDDTLVTIDGVAVVNCDAVLKVVQGHDPGDEVKLGILRFGRQPMTIGAQLISRDEILRRRHVGQPIAPTELVGVDDQRRIDLSEQRGKTTIVGWYDVRRCADCAAVFSKIATWTRAQAGKPGAQPVSLAVTRGDTDPVDPNQIKVLKSTVLDVPLAIAEDAVFDNYTIADGERVSLMVIDCRGVVQYVSPIAPNSDDTDAVLDELFAAVEQAARRLTK